MKIQAETNSQPFFPIDKSWSDKTTPTLARVKAGDLGRGGGVAMQHAGSSD